MKRNYLSTPTTNIKGKSCAWCNKIFPIGDARSMRREIERHNKKCDGQS